MTGPKWQPTRRIGDVYIVLQTDTNGVVWMLMEREQGGRVLRWQSVGDMREATTTATPAHPGYPTDAAVEAEQKQVDREAREQRRAYARMGLIP